ncbi:MAG: DinB family protein [Firmicutes bacterium]|nr:DinB family protein [Bacillota bacterium]
MVRDLMELYGWVRGSRAVLFEYLESLPPGAYTKELSGFPLGGSMRNLHVHAADCYMYWLEYVGLEQPRRDLRFEDYPDPASVREAFAEVDALVERFLGHFADRIDEPLHRVLSWRPQGLTVTPRWLLLHPITHEFHHKGQLVVIGRQLGHIPPETDLAFPG